MALTTHHKERPLFSPTFDSACEDSLCHLLPLSLSDDTAGRYRGLRFGQLISIHDSDPGLLVRPEVARRQRDAEIAPPPPPPVEGGDGRTDPPPPIGPKPGPGPGPRPRATLRRFYGSATLDPTRVGRDAARIAEEVLSHLTGLVGVSVKVTLDIEVQLPEGAPDHVVRTVTENSRTLKFDQAGFEES